MPAYYNEFCPFAAQWLRNLISAGQIAPGVVDERSIADVQPEDVGGYEQVHLFAGVGAWSLACRYAGIPDDFPIWSGSCPCQPWSSAGSQRGSSDDRHLWPEMFRLIKACRPGIVVGEQVASSAVVGASGKAKRKDSGKAEQVWFDGIRSDLEAASYACGGVDIPSASVGAPHIRQRLFWIARDCGVADAQSNGTSDDWSARRDESDTQRNGNPGRLADAGFKSSQRHPGGFSAAQAGVDRAGTFDGCFADGSEHGFTAGGLADAQRPQRRSPSVTRVDITNGDEAGRAEGTSGSRVRGEHDRLADADGRDASAKRQQRSGERVGNTIQSGLERHAGHGNDGNESRRLGTHANRSTPAAGPWSSFAIIRTSDGKYRRVPAAIEPKIFCVVARPAAILGSVCPDRYPLAEKTPARVGRLKGYGNRINPVLAAEFLLAALMETEIGRTF